MAAFEWLPTVDEKIAIVQGILEELTYQECGNLVKELHRYTAANGYTNNLLNIAFFSHLRSALYDDFIWALLKQHGVENILEQSLSQRYPRLKTEINFSTIMEKGKQLIGSSKYINHLEGGE
jgi:hypothetical protein